MKEPSIHFILGPKQSGKTTMLMDLMEELKGETKFDSGGLWVIFKPDKNMYHVFLDEGDHNLIKCQSIIRDYMNLSNSRFYIVAEGSHWDFPREFSKRFEKQITKQNREIKVITTKPFKKENSK